jgi:hypothetical protein
MTRIAGPGLVVVVLGLAVPYACGGKAVIDGSAVSSTGSGGTGGTSSTTNTSGTTSPSSSAPTSGTGGAPATLCPQICAALEPCGVVADCDWRCEGGTPACAALHEAWLACLLAELPAGSCSPPAACDAAFAAWRDCAVHVDESPYVPCSVPEYDYCLSWTHLTDGYGVTVAADCESLGDQPHCTCSLDDMPFGECTDDEEACSCDPLYGCCSLLFFVPYGAGGE